MKKLQKNSPPIPAGARMRYRAIGAGHIRIFSRQFRAKPQCLKFAIAPGCEKRAMAFALLMG
jgi:hypothetical protein